MIGARGVVLAAALGAFSCHASIESPYIVMTKVQGTLDKEIPVNKHKKEAGGGYKKGSPLYDKQQKLAEKHDEPEPDRTKPGLAVIFGAILVGLAILICAAFINKQELVKKVPLEQKIPKSITRLQSQSLSQVPVAQAPVEPVAYVRPPTTYSLPQSSGVVYATGSLTPGSFPGTPTAVGQPVTYSMSSQSLR